MCNDWITDVPFLCKVHVEMEDKADKIVVEGPAEDVEKVRVALTATVQDLLSKLTFADVIVDPKYHKHIIGEICFRIIQIYCYSWRLNLLGKGGANVNRLKDETGVTINIPDERSSTIRIEGTRDGVDQAKAELMEMVAKMENEREKDILIEHRFHKNFIGTKGERIREIRDMFHQVHWTVFIQIFSRCIISVSFTFIGPDHISGFVREEWRRQNPRPETGRWRRVQAHAETVQGAVGILLFGQGCPLPLLTLWHTLDQQAILCQLLPVGPDL